MRIMEVYIMIMTACVKNNKIFLLLLIFASSFSYAACEENRSNFHDFDQKIFVYAGFQEGSWYLIDNWSRRVYMTLFQDKKMTLQKTDEVSISSTSPHFTRLRLNMLIDPAELTTRNLSGKQVSADTFLDLSITDDGLILFLMNLPKYLAVNRDGSAKVMSWPFIENEDSYFLGGYFLNGTLIVLVADDENVYFYRSSGGLIWEKLDFSLPSFVRGYTYNNLFWVVTDQGEKYSSIDGSDWQVNTDGGEFNRYLFEYEFFRAKLIEDLRASNHIIYSIDGDHREGIVIGSCNKRVGSKVEYRGFLLHHKNNKYTMYKDFDIKKTLPFIGESWELGSE